jgi:hypothetical protein
MTPQPRPEPFKPTPRGTISTKRHLTRSLFASPLQEGPSLSPGEGLQQQLRRLQQRVRELLITNQELRTMLESANESPGQGTSPLNAPGTSDQTNHTRGHYESNDASDK